MPGGGELPENAFATEYIESLAAGGGELPENAFATEYIESVAPVWSATAADGSDDYGIWTSEPPSTVPAGVKAAGEVGRKKKAA